MPPTSTQTLLILMRMRARMAWNFISNWHTESRLKIVVVSGLGLGFWIALFMLFNEGAGFSLPRRFSSKMCWFRRS